MSQYNKLHRSLARRSAIVAAITLAFAGSAGAAYINDGGFESPALGGNSYLYQYSPGFTPQAGVTFFGNSGVANGGFSVASAPQGSQYGFIRSGYYDASTGMFPHSSITFDVSGLSAGVYNVSFLASLRPDYGVNPIEVLFNSIVLGTFAPTSGTAFESFTTTFTATGSTGSLQFMGLADDGDYDTALDNILISATFDTTPPVVPVVPPAPTGTIPEPASIALLGPGIVGGVFSRRRSVAAKRV